MTDEAVEANTERLVEILIRDEARKAIVQMDTYALARALSSAGVYASMRVNAVTGEPMPTDWRQAGHDADCEADFGQQGQESPCRCAIRFRALYSVTGARPEGKMLCPGWDPTKGGHPEDCETCEGTGWVHDPAVRRARAFGSADEDGM